MADYIDRQAALKTFREMERDIDEVLSSCYLSYDTQICQRQRKVQLKDCVTAIERLPNVNTRDNQRGHWLLPSISRPMYECNLCGWYVDKGGYLDFSYCPNCGARMDGGEVDADR